MIDNDSTVHQSSLMRIIKQRSVNHVDEEHVEKKMERHTTGGQLYKIKKKFEEGNRTEQTLSTLDINDFPCRPGNVASLKAQLSPQIKRSLSTFSNSSDTSVNSVLSSMSQMKIYDSCEINIPRPRSSKHNIYENSTLRASRGPKPVIPPKPSYLYPKVKEDDADSCYEVMDDNIRYENVKYEENGSVFSENSAEYESISGESRECEITAEPNVYENIDENVLQLPYIEPVGETSDGIYEDLDIPDKNDQKFLETCIDNIGDDDDDFGFEICEIPEELRIKEIGTFNDSVQSLPESKRNKYKRKLKERIEELIQSETNYIERLKRIVYDYMPEMDNNDNAEIAVTSDFTKDNIFFNIEVILNFHTQVILPNLKRHRRNLKNLAEIFIKKEQLSTLYIDYATNYKKANQIVFENNGYFKAKQMELNEKLNLAGYLLEPVQRLPRYALFLDELLKAYKLYAEGKREDSAYYSARNSPTYQKTEDDEDVGKKSKNEEEDKIMYAFQDASVTIKSILNRIDDNLTVSNIKKSFVSLRDQGDLLLHNEFTVTQSGKRYSMRCFLFVKNIIFTVIDKSQLKEESYIYHDSIPVEQLGITPPESEDSKKFEIWCLKRDIKSFYLESSVKICQRWVKKISSLLWEEAEYKKQLVNNREGEKWTKSLRPIKKKDDESTNDSCNESIAGSSMSWSTPPDKYSSLRGVRGEISRAGRPTKIRTTWYLDEDS